MATAQGVRCDDLSHNPFAADRSGRSFPHHTQRSAPVQVVIGLATTNGKMSSGPLRYEGTIHTGKAAICPVPVTPILPRRPTLTLLWRTWRARRKGGFP